MSSENGQDNGGQGDEQPNRNEGNDDDQGYTRGRRPRSPTAVSSRDALIPSDGKSSEMKTRANDVVGEESSSVVVIDVGDADDVEEEEDSDAVPPPPGGGGGSVAREEIISISSGSVTPGTEVTSTLPVAPFPVDDAARNSVEAKPVVGGKKIKPEKKPVPQSGKNSQSAPPEGAVRHQPPEELVVRMQRTAGVTLFGGKQLTLNAGVKLEKPALPGPNAPFCRVCGTNIHKVPTELWTDEVRDRNQKKRNTKKGTQKIQEGEAGPFPVQTLCPLAKYPAWDWWCSRCGLSGHLRFNCPSSCFTKCDSKAGSQVVPGLPKGMGRQEQDQFVEDSFNSMPTDHFKEGCNYLDLATQYAGEGDGIRPDCGMRLSKGQTLVQMVPPQTFVNFFFPGASEALASNTPAPNAGAKETLAKLIDACLSQHEGQLTDVTVIHWLHGKRDKILDKFFIRALGIDYRVNAAQHHRTPVYKAGGYQYGEVPAPPPLPVDDSKATPGSRSGAASPFAPLSSVGSTNQAAMKESKKTKKDRDKKTGKETPAPQPKPRARGPKVPVLRFYRPQGSKQEFYDSYAEMMACNGKNIDNPSDNEAEEQGYTTAPRRRPPTPPPAVGVADSRGTGETGMPKRTATTYQSPTTRDSDQLPLATPAATIASGRFSNTVESSPTGFRPAKMAKQEESTQHAAMQLKLVAGGIYKPLTGVGDSSSDEEDEIRSRSSLPPRVSDVYVCPKPVLSSDSDDDEPVEVAQDEEEEDDDSEREGCPLEEEGEEDDDVFEVDVQEVELSMGQQEAPVEGANANEEDGGLEFEEDTMPQPAAAEGVFTAAEPQQQQPEREDCPPEDEEEEVQQAKLDSSRANAARRAQEASENVQRPCAEDAYAGTGVGGGGGGMMGQLGANANVALDADGFEVYDPALFGEPAVPSPRAGGGEGGGPEEWGDYNPADFGDDVVIELTMGQQQAPVEGANDANEEDGGMEFEEDTMPQPAAAEVVFTTAEPQQQEPSDGGAGDHQASSEGDEEVQPVLEQEGDMPLQLPSEQGEVENNDDGDAVPMPVAAAGPLEAAVTLCWSCAQPMARVSKIPPGYAGFDCNKCEKEIDNLDDGEYVLRCKACDFDLCMDCGLLSPLKPDDDDNEEEEEEMV